eukprot:CAMPEP_0114121590 /NCGR_PEP_ID=MMETSP0043_2-20121206/7256_1 /TAXON_ID=464988 /ORGANISM="Hemiselmis andersenii, Strain CCMP644" /LENGTH=86 /DNA_ID=CAMNT_0001214275 /DNA_START=283 /DNA_END=540 /DNA_ORIENTATION=+
MMTISLPCEAGRSQSSTSVAWGGRAPASQHSPASPREEDPQGHSSPWSSDSRRRLEGDGADEVDAEDIPLCVRATSIYSWHMTPSW